MPIPVNVELESYEIKGRVFLVVVEGITNSASPLKVITTHIYIYMRVSWPEYVIYEVPLSPIRGLTPNSSYQIPRYIWSWPPLKKHKGRQTQRPTASLCLMPIMFQKSRN